MIMIGFQASSSRTTWDYLVRTAFEGKCNFLFVEKPEGRSLYLWSRIIVRSKSARLYLFIYNESQFCSVLFRNRTGRKAFSRSPGSYKFYYCYKVWPETLVRLIKSYCSENSLMDGRGTISSRSLYWNADALRDSGKLFCSWCHVKGRSGLLCLEPNQYPTAMWINDV